MEKQTLTSLCDLPPSAKLVFKVLEYSGAHTQKEIVQRSRLSARTVRSALENLADVGAVTEEVYIPDARQRLYRLDDSRDWEQVNCLEEAPV
ncbi:MarR family transcriptional regulator [Haladaptatus sp. DFWS20]|uniref:MarR family transcriptional regulator n=1 Tax=Haladaptatus sp. DFWS20 TaxID=3403467 RepID=UPI003EBBAA0D